MDDSAVLVFLSLSLMSWRSASRSLLSGFSSFAAVKKTKDTFPCWSESLHNTAGSSRLVPTDFIWRRYWIQLTCTFPWFAVLWSVTGNARGTSATVTLFCLVIILIWKHPVVRWHCGNEILISYCRTFNITIQLIVENAKNSFAVLLSM